MALYKYQQFISRSEHAAFDDLHLESTAVKCVVMKLYQRMEIHCRRKIITSTRNTKRLSGV